MQVICRHQGIKTQLLSKTRPLEIEERLERLSEVNDQLLEDVASCMDRHSGLNRFETSNPDVVIIDSTKVRLGR